MITSSIAHDAPAHGRRWPRARSSWIAWMLGALTVIQLGTAIALAAMNRLPPERWFAEFVVPQALAALAMAIVGIAIVVQRPGNAVGWLLVITGAAFAHTTWLGQYVRYTVVTAPGALPATDAMIWLSRWSFLPLIALIVGVLPLLFPSGRLPSPRWRPALWIVAAATILHVASVAIAPGAVDATVPEARNPYPVAGAEGLVSALRIAAIALTVVALVLAIAAPVTRYRRARGPERQQLKWFACAAVVVVAGFVLPFVLLGPARVIEQPFIAGVVRSFTVPALPLAIGIAILRHGLFDIDLLINRVLVYAGLTAGVIGQYVLVVVYLGAVFGMGDGLLGSLVATAVVAILFQPLREQLQRGVNRLLYGERDEPYAVLSRLGRRLEETLDPESALPTIVAAVGEALKVPYAAIALAQEGRFVMAAAAGEPAPDPLRLPLAYQGEVIGELLVGRRTPGEAFSSGDRRLLEDLARQAGIAAHAVRLTADLRRSRERLVSAREEERRRLRRDLHDGVGPALSSAMLKLSAVRHLLPPETNAGPLLSEVRSDLAHLVADVRRLAYDLRPPVLDQLGLVAAIRELAERSASPESISQPRLVVRVEAPDELPPLPAAVEVAAYRIVQEALTNIVRHARARQCVIRVEIEGPDTEPAAVHLEISDDGTGMPPDWRPGVGVSAMRERAAELGGECEVRANESGGTRILARLPIDRTLP
jgi:signal transduction histidine kinase